MDPQPVQVFRSQSPALAARRRNVQQGMCGERRNKAIATYVLDPPKYAEVLLSIAKPNENWNAGKIKRMFGTAEQDIHFQNVIPVHLTYQTATVEDGQLVLRKDIYGYDAKTIAAIKSERGMIEVAQERPKENPNNGAQVRRPRASEPRTTSFFEALFGGPAYARPAPQPQQPQRRVR
jgi:hypothetical protein